MEKANIPKVRFDKFNDDWEQRKVSELCSISTGKSNTQDKSEDGEYPFYVRSPIIERSTKYLYDEEAVITVGDGVGTGKVFHYVNGKYDLHQRCYRMYGFSDELNAHYFYHTFSKLFYKRVMAMTAKTSVDSVRLEMIADMEIPTPTIEEQIKIGTYFDHLDHLITLHQRKYEKLQMIKKSMLEKMFPQNGEKKPEIRFEGFTDDWEQRKLGELGEIMTGSTPSTLKAEYYSEDGIPWVTPTDINARTISDTPRKLSEKGATVGRVAPANTILCTCIASIGKNTLLTVKGSFNQQINSLTPNDENDAYFLLTESEIWSNKMKLMAASGTMLIVNKTEFSELLTMVPKLTEQKKIGDYFRHLDHLITLHQRKLEKLRNIKKSMLEKMFV